jgi:hypothetical protein
MLSKDGVQCMKTRRTQALSSHPQMIKFFYRDIFRLPMFEDVKFLLRIDDDSCFPSGLPDVFQVKKNTGLDMNVTSIFRRL